MRSSGTSITCEVGLQLIVPDRAPVPLVARLDYSVDDPYAIRAAFHVGDDEPVEWIFARELLTEIGRASCREREETTGGAGEHKKKHDESTKQSTTEHET